MILMALFELVFLVLQVLFAWLNLPDLPQQLTSVVDTMIGYVVDGLPILWLFFDKSIVSVCMVVALACMNFDKIYDLLMWIIAKIPIGIRKN